jgi:curved DNA-binding protein CbpA
MSKTEFVDYYEVLQLSPNADADTIERVFRHLAKKFHPDNINSADNEIFIKIVEAYRTLADPETRAGYDVQYQDYWNNKWKLTTEANDKTALDDDQKTREYLLSLMYTQRRRNMKNPGLGDYEMARLLGKPVELLEFHLWYLKAKGWLERLDSGLMAISARGVDQVEQGRLRFRNDNLLMAPPVDSVNV